MEPQKTLSASSGDQDPKEETAVPNDVLPTQAVDAGNDGKAAADSLWPAAGEASSTKDVMGTPPSPADQPSPSLPIGLDAAPAPLAVAPPKAHKKGLIIGIIAAVLVFVLSASAAAAYYYVVNTPENTLKRALANVIDSGKTKTMHYSGELKMDDAASKLSISATFNGALNNETGAMDLSASLDALVTKLTFDVRSTDGKTFYAKVGGLSGLPELLASDPSNAAYAPLIEAANGQWYEINQSIVKQLSGGSLKDEKLSDGDRTKLADMYLKHPFFKITEKLPDETIKGTKSRHYKLIIDKTEVKAFAAELKKANIRDFQPTDDQLKEFNKSTDETDFSKVPIEVWIAKNSKRFTQASLKVNEDGVSMTLRFTVESYDKPVTVEKPAGAKSLLDLLGASARGTGAELDLPDLGNGISL